MSATRVLTGGPSCEGWEVDEKPQGVPSGVAITEVR